MHLRTLAPLLIPLTFAACAAHASKPPLSAPELKQCAAHAQTLRTESARLLQENAELDAQRASINQQLETIKAERAAASREDLDRGLALQQRTTRYQQEAHAFNRRIETYKQQVRALNQTRQAYDTQCSDRPYLRSDLEALPPEAQNAMRRGLSDVQVPYLGNE